MDQRTASQLIDEMGGTGAVASLCDISSQAVSKWRKSGIPAPWLKYFQLQRPELFCNGLPTEQAQAA